MRDSHPPEPCFKYPECKNKLIIVHARIFRASAEYVLGAVMGTPKTRSGAYLWLGTFAGVYMLVLTVFIVLAAAWSNEPQLPPSTGKETCAPYGDGGHGIASCLA